MDTPVPQADTVRPTPEVDTHPPADSLDRLWGRPPGDTDRPAGNWRPAS